MLWPLTSTPGRESGGRAGEERWAEDKMVVKEEVKEEEEHDEVW